MNILANAAEKLLDEAHKRNIENSPILEKTPPEFYLKALVIIVVVVGFSLFVKNYMRRKK